MRWTLLFVLSAGCDPGEPAERPSPVMAAILETYAAPAAIGFPSVRWHVDDLDCDGTAWTPPAWKSLEGYRPGLGCVRGLFDEKSPHEIQIALPGGRVSPAVLETMAHEAAHWFLFATTGNADTDHAGRFFVPGGQVAAAAAAAKRAGFE